MKSASDISAEIGKEVVALHSTAEYYVVGVSDTSTLKEAHGFSPIPDPNAG